MVAINQVTGEKFFGLGDTIEEAEYQVFLKLPESAIRVGDIFTDKHGNEWKVTWYVGEKVKLVKVSLSGKTNEYIMVYLKNGDYMSFTLRYVDRFSKQTGEVSNPDDLSLRTMVYKVMRKAHEQNIAYSISKIPKNFLKGGNGYE
jgi:hypothetical protein